MTMLDFYATPARVRPARPSSGHAPEVVIYGNRWCGLTQLTARTLDRAGIDYHYVDLDEHPYVERRLRTLAGGRLRTPVVYVDGQWLIAPSTAQLRSALMRAEAVA